MTCKALRVPRIETRNDDNPYYVAKFTELAYFMDDYVATDMAKVRKFEDGLKYPSGVKLWDSSYNI